MNRRTCLLTFSLAALLLGAARAFPAPREEQTPTRKFEILFEQAQNGDSLAAEKLARLSHVVDGSGIDDRTLSNIASLLGSPKGDIRMWAAAAIGDFGVRASIYAPRLQQIVTEESCNFTGIGSADTAARALEKMGMIPAPFGCSRR